MPRPQQTYQPQPQAQQSIEESRKIRETNHRDDDEWMTSSNIDALTFDRQKINLILDKTSKEFTSAYDKLLILKIK